MSLVLRVLTLIGWQGGVGAALGALIATVPAYHGGRVVEGAATQSRIEAALADARISRMEVEDERLLEADRARRSARRERDGDGRMPDDGFLRE